MDRVLKTALATFIGLTVATSAQASDPNHGKDLFQAKCTLCHNADKGGPNKLGPNLWGVVGRPAASLPNFPYSSAMQNAHVTWSADQIQKYLMGPQAMLPGIRMTFPGFSKAEDAADVATYLATLK